MTPEENFFYDVKEINALAESDPLRLATLSEQHYARQLDEIFDRVGKSRIIALSGPSSSGKTTSAVKLKELFISHGIEAVVISLDDFYINRADLPIIDGKPNAEVIDALKVNMITDCLNRLLRTGEAMLPSYDFNLGIRTDNARKITVSENCKLIVEGIHALNEKIHRGLPHNELFRIYASPHSGFVKDGSVCLTKRELRSIRRIVRDSHSRGTDAETTLERWPSVCEGEDLYVRPLIGSADYRLDTTHMYEPCLLRNLAVKLLSGIHRDSREYDYATHLISAVEEFTELPIKSMPESSLLVEFLGKPNL